MSISAHACALDAHEHFHGQDGITCACAHEHRDEENPRKLVVAILLFALGFGLYYSINTGFAASLNGVLSGILPSAALAAIVSFLPSEDSVSSEFAPYFVFTFAILVAAYLLSGLGVLKIALKNAMRGEFFDENFLMSVATLGAFALGAYPEAAAVMIFYAIGEIIEGANVGRSTFYAHFATKDELLFALCTQIVEHVLEGADKKEAGDFPLGDGLAGRLEHILWHVEANGETIRHILSSEGERAFTRYFEEYLEEIFGGAMTRVEGAREDYALNAAVSAFSQTVR